MDNFLGRNDAPFGEVVWNLLDHVVIEAAKSVLTGRRVLDIEGPYGLGLKQIPLEDRVINDGSVTLSASKSVPVPLIDTGFTLSARDIAGFVENGFAMDMSAVAGAAQAVAAMEDSIIFEGNKALGVDGLLTASGTQSVKLSNWDAIGAASTDIISAVTKLDDKGFHGPYTLALAPGLYNLLFRLYPQGGPSEMEHISGVVGSRIIKAPSLKSGGVLLASGKQFASIVVGQDMATGYVGPAGSGYEFMISESIAPRVRVPASVCVLKV